MARYLDLETLNELGSDEMFPFFCLDFTDGVTDYKYTTLDVPITLNVSGGPSGVYEPRGFQFEGINYTLSNVMDDATIKIDNLDSVLTPIFVTDDIEEQPASIYLGIMNTAADATNEVLITILLFTGEIDSFDIDETEIRMVIGSIFSRWGHQSNNTHPSSCRWKLFKGVECQYSGDAASCDRVYETCVTLDNTANFGGFRWLPSIENKKIQFGPNQSEASWLSRHDHYVT